MPTSPFSRKSAASSASGERGWREEGGGRVEGTPSQGEHAPPHRPHPFILLCSDFDICAFANCTVSFASNPPIAECGCLPVRGGDVKLPLKPNGYPVPEPYNVATAAVILDKKAKVPSVKLCNDSSVATTRRTTTLRPSARTCSRR